MPNAWVFPGGALDAHADVSAALCARAHVPLQRTRLSLYDDVAQQLHIDTTIGEYHLLTHDEFSVRRALQVCALRELYEE
jgi:8-oxo-dGTP pyrophosphatase MutT (NUDIX family)